jgi:hypothetical protein
MNTAVTGLGKEANDGCVFNLVVGCGAQAYFVGVEQFM